MAANDYATLDDARLYGYQSSDDDDELLEPIITRASRMFDRYCGVKAGHFAKGLTTQVASARKFWGDGTDYLKLDPYLSGQTLVVAMPTGYTVPPYIESKDEGHQADNGQGFYLIRTYSNNESRYGFVKDSNIDEYAGALFAANINYIGWPIGVKVTVTAKWGFDAVLEDIKEAVLETAIAIWRGRDQAFSRVVNLETNIQVVDAMPARAKVIADRYRASNGVMFV